MAPDYDPYPGGVRRDDIDPALIPPESLPGPVDGYDDGIHPSELGWEVLTGHLYDQGLGRLLAREDW